MSASRTSVLVGFGDALAAPEVAASLLKHGHHVASFIRRGQRLPLRRMKDVELIEVSPPEADLEACLREVSAAAVGFDVTLPLNDAAVLVCDRALPADALLAGPRGQQAKLALDKRLQLRAASAAALAVPTWREICPGDALPEDLGSPLVLKPALAVEEVAGRLRRLSPSFITHQDELDRAWERMGEATPVLVQRRVTGSGAGVFGLSDADGLHQLTAHRRVRMMNPTGSGSSACAAAPVPAELVAPIERFLTHAGWSGMFMVELLRGDEGWWFMELNGRAWGSLALSRRLGYEYPAWAVARALHPEAELPVAPPFRDMLCRNLGRELVHLLFVLRGPRQGADSWPTRWGTVKALARHPRGTTWYNRAPDLQGVFLYDAWRTVADQTLGRIR